MAENGLKIKTQETYRFRKPLDQMSANELCDEAVRIRNIMVEHSERLNEIYGTLYSKARRDANEESYSYISISNSGKRFAGMVHQAARRTAGVETRILTVVARDVVDRNRQKQEEVRRLAEVEEDQQKRLSIPKDPLEALYGIPSISTDEIGMLSQAVPNTTPSDIDDLYGEELS